MSTASEAHQQNLADLRHDLCTPINQILGYSEMLEEDAAASQQQSLSTTCAKSNAPLPAC